MVTYPRPVPVVDAGRDPRVLEPSSGCSLAWIDRLVRAVGVAVRRILVSCLYHLFHACAGPSVSFDLSTFNMKRNLRAQLITNSVSDPTMKRIPKDDSCGPGITERSRGPNGTLSSPSSTLFSLTGSSVSG
ncbi:hypothetical protein GGTG_10598 [Gaeumannomyces tritici R3-111a-1]|uniref:Uncharacterized protein n=1 Tax=Gaeumannomyces tritici (strain R3-111a-1) TaxID=644352 RepID=J3PAS3_GAET3|nr:hypothetical protein GGTG_10598 [Gaeumannomyces tritici R3-111a-1]EJT71339.1 hypothetical protein GGTG_10598 [Gaeumannomyces tritici R3-111a-1]